MIRRITHHIHKHTISFHHAWEGILWALRTQPNYRIHYTISILTLCVAIVLKVDHADFLSLLLLVVLGIVIETINTAIECACDAVTTEYRINIKHAKDVAAGAMLSFAIGATIIAFYILLPYIWRLLVPFIAIYFSRIPFL